MFSTVSGQDEDVYEGEGGREAGRQAQKEGQGEGRASGSGNMIYLCGCNSVSKVTNEW